MYFPQGTASKVNSSIPILRKYIVISLSLQGYFLFSSFLNLLVSTLMLHSLDSRKISAMFAVLRINTKVKDTQKSDTIVLNMMSKLVIACNFHALKGPWQVKLGLRFCFHTEKPLKVLKLKHFHDYLFNSPMGTFSSIDLQYS